MFPSSGKKVIELLDDDPKVVDLLIEYLYANHSGIPDMRRCPNSRGEIWRRERMAHFYVIITSSFLFISVVTFLKSRSYVFSNL